MRIIGLTGAAGAGKDTVCAAMKEWGTERGIEVRRFAFADALKESAARSLGAFGSTTSESVAYCNWLKRPGVVIGIHDKGEPGVENSSSYREISGRSFLQYYGTEAHRDVFGDDFWVDALMGRIARRCEGFQGIVVVTDVRFPNEGRAVINSIGGEVWRVVRPDLEPAESHASEAGLDDDLVALELDNAGSVGDLRNMVYLTCDANLTAPWR